MSRELTWLATDPPIFAVWHRHDGFEMKEELVVFERCKAWATNESCQAPMASSRSSVPITPTIGASPGRVSLGAAGAF